MSVRKLLLTTFCFSLLTGCDSYKIQLEAKAGEYNQVILEDTPPHGSTTAIMIMNKGDLGTEWSPSVSFGYQENPNNSLQIILYQNNFDTKLLTLSYRHIVDGKVRTVENLEEGIKYGESKIVKVDWNMKGIYTIYFTNIRKVTLETEIINPKQVFSVASGNGTVILKDR